MDTNDLVEKKALLAQTARLARDPVFIESFYNPLMRMREQKLRILMDKNSTESEIRYAQGVVETCEYINKLLRRNENRSKMLAKEEAHGARKERRH